MKRFLTLLALLLPLQGFAAIDTYEFQDEASRERFRSLTTELRCPKCQNQNLADSDAPIAKDLRAEVHRMLGEGQSDNDIVDFMVARYGEFVLYRPRNTASTWVLWYGPFVLLALGAVVVFLVAGRRRKKAQLKTDSAESESAPVTASEGLSAEEQQRLKQMLQQDKD